ncbi:hypothetical protein [Hydrogenophaga sp. PAMC20947]|nr:hypothetical protein [Hydrogenophaga sp. PAMC20947]
MQPRQPLPSAETTSAWTAPIAPAILARADALHPCPASSEAH